MFKTAESIGANTFQFFTRNPRGGTAKAIDIDDVNIKLNIENVSKNVIASYDFENTDYKNSIITINLNIYKNDKFFLLDNFDSIESIIQHELLHAYEDLKRYESGKKLFSNIIDDSYTKSFYYVKYSLPWRYYQWVR